jgi:hypothetical protein
MILQKTELITSAAIVMLGIISETTLSDVLAVLGGVLLVINQYYRLNRNVNKNHNGSWKSYFKSLKNKKNAK